MKSNLLKYSSLFVAVITILSVCAFSNNTDDDNLTTVDEKGIKFIEQDWSQALEQAKKENKFVFLDIYAVWCGPCKMLKRNTFTDAKVAEFFNNNFVNVSVDGEKSIGPELAQKFSIQGYPTLIVTDANGKPILYTVGYVDADYLLKFANEALKKKL